VTLKKYTLIKLTLILFLILFFIIYIIELNYVLEVSKISDLSKRNVNEYVLISGKIITENLINKTLFIKIQDNTSVISGVIFNSGFLLNKSKEYNFEGKISIYNNKIELLIKKVY